MHVHFLRTKNMFIVSMEIPYFLVIRRILLISAYLLLSACHFPDLSTRYYAHFAYKRICDP